jgi:hypothetical protein
VKTESVVVLHSPSGAGKTSLLQSVIVRRLSSQFDVLPIVRVGLAPPEALQRGLTSANRYLESALLSLAQARPDWADERSGPMRPGILRAALEELRDLRSMGSKTQLLILDQFEEIISLDPTDEPAKREFFVELGTALRHSRCTVILSCREEFLGDLEPYLQTLTAAPVRKYRLELLRETGAREAIVRPAEREGVSFDDAALAQLLTNLLQTKVRGSGNELISRAGTLVEPVQLQVVCHSLWETRVKQGYTAVNHPNISLQEISLLGNVESVLAEYFSTHVQRVAKATNTREGVIREWIERELIAEGRVRNQVLKGVASTRQLDNRVLESLEEARLIRAEERRGFVWYELTHDSLLEPVRESNKRWRQGHVPGFHLRLREGAQQWKVANRPRKLLIGIAELAHFYGIAAFLKFPDSNFSQLSALETEFVWSSLKRARRKLLSYPIVITLVALVLFGFVLPLYVGWVRHNSENTYWQLSSEILDLEAELQTRSYNGIPRQTVRLDTLKDLPAYEEFPRPEPERPANFGPAEQLAERRVAAAALQAAQRPIPNANRYVLHVPVNLSPQLLTSVRPLGFLIVPDGPASSEVPNSLTFGDRVPLEAAKAIALSFVSGAHGINRIRRFDPAGFRANELEVVYDDRVRFWPPLTVEQLSRLVIPPTAAHLP